MSAKAWDRRRAWKRVRQLLCRSGAWRDPWIRGEYDKARARKHRA